MREKQNINHLTGVVVVFVWKREQNSVQFSHKSVGSFFHKNSANIQWQLCTLTAHNHPSTRQYPSFSWKIAFSCLNCPNETTKNLLKIKYRRIFQIPFFYHFVHFNLNKLNNWFIQFSSCFKFEAIKWTWKRNWKKMLFFKGNSIYWKI